MSSDVFVSYASQDASVANSIAESLEGQGLKCWIAPRDVKPGAQYADAIVRAINEAKAVVLVLSGNGVASAHVGREVERASSKNKRIIAFRIDAAPLNAALEYFLSQSQWIDAKVLGMPAALAKLTEAVGQEPSRLSQADAVLSGGGADGPAASEAPGHGHGLPIKIPFLEQIKRRHVGRVAILYIGTGYLILEFFGTFLHVLALPQWTGQALAALLVAGFPVVLLLAWIFEATPHGLKPAAEVDVNPATRKLTGRRLDFAIIIVLVLALGYFAADKFWLSKRTVQAAGASAAARSAAVPAAAPVISDKSIAVLPFTDMSQKKDQEYFGDGMAEEILDLLAKIPGLTVIGRTSSFQFKGRNEDLRKIGTELNAAYVLEGSVRSSGDQVRITAQLINTKTGAHEWSDTYDRPLGDVLKMQDAIAAAVVRELQLTMDPGYLPSRSTLKSTEAYDLILRGRHAADRWDKEGLDEAVTLFQQALDRDPSSAEALAELAFTHYKLGADIFLAPAAAFEPARREATTALQLDPKNVLAHLVLSRISMAYDWDWSAAEHELQEVTRLAPGRADGLNGEAHLSLIKGRWDDALLQIQAALGQDPMDANSFQYLALIQARRGRLPEAEAAIRRALDIRPTYAFGHYYLGLFLLERGNREAPLIIMEQETTDGGKQAGLAIVNYALGRRKESDTSLTRLVKERADVDAFNIAAVFAFRGELDEAMHWLERAYVQKDASLFFIKFEPALTNLENDPRYKAFLKKMNLPE